MEFQYYDKVAYNSNLLSLDIHWESIHKEIIKESEILESEWTKWHDK
jgi:hypothetical protein